MNGINFETMNDFTKGVLAVTAGFILLLYTLGLLGAWINGIFIFFAIAIILYGFTKLGLVSYWQKMIGNEKEEHKHEKKTDELRDEHTEKSQTN